MANFAFVISNKTSENFFFPTEFFLQINNSKHLMVEFQNPNW